MRKTFFILFLFIINAGYSQVIRINFMAGLSNYYGEIQPKKFTVSQSNAVIGAGATLDVTNKILLRGELNLTNLGANDNKSTISTYRQRNLNFKTNIQELALMAEYNFFDIYEHKITPYAFVGLGAFRYKSYTMDSVYGKVFLNGLSTEGQGLSQYPDRKIYRNVQLNVPIGGGVKYAISDDIQFGLEYGLRKLFTDYLDDVSTRYIDENILRSERGPVAVAVAFRGDELKTDPRAYPRAGTLRGSPKEKDYYYYALARLSIRMNWFDGAGYKVSKSRVACPGNVL